LGDPLASRFALMTECRTEDIGADELTRPARVTGIGRSAGEPIRALMTECRTEDIDADELTRPARVTGVVSEQQNGHRGRVRGRV